MEKRKRKSRDGSSLSFAQSKDARGVRGKNQKKCISVRKDDEEEIKKANKAYNINKKKDKEEVVLNHEQVPTGYIHVRARRGQATDSHSLAERVRREKISERMKLLQALVPGCDKVTGKALMLDEIINYVQSLQNQVEFLSMKLATVNPMLYDFGMDLDALMVTSERLNGLVSPLPNVQQIVPNNYPLLDSSSSFVFQEGQKPITLSQDNGQLLWDVDEQRRQSQLINQSGFGNNLCSFH